jgi:uncharacterized Fe-S cluster-containing radical SAM superfamily protein
MREFILETNGLLLGHEPGLVQLLSQFERLELRVALKGFDEESFEVISGAERGFFTIPLKGLGDLIRNGIRAWPAIMYEAFGPGGIGEINEPPRRKRTGYLVLVARSSQILKSFSCLIRFSASDLSIL